MKKVSKLGKYERDMITKMMGLLPKMEFQTHRRRKSDGVMVDVYDIPDDRKAELLEELYPFAPSPSMDDTLFDLHEGRSFKVRDFMVVREDNSNFAVSPYYLHSGGTILDWLPLESEKDGKDERHLHTYYEVKSEEICLNDEGNDTPDTSSNTRNA